MPLPYWKIFSPSSQLFLCLKCTTGVSLNSQLERWIHSIKIISHSCHKIRAFTIFFEYDSPIAIHYFYYSFVSVGGQLILHFWLWHLNRPTGTEFVLSACTNPFKLCQTIFYRYKGKRKLPQSIFELSFNIWWTKNFKTHISKYVLMFINSPKP